MARPQRRSVVASTKFMASSWRDALAQADAKAPDDLSKYIIADMFAKTVQGMAPEESVNRADDEFRRSCST